VLAKSEVVVVDGVEWIHTWIPTTGSCESFEGKEKDGTTKQVNGANFTCWGSTKITLASGKVLVVKASAKWEVDSSQQVCNAPPLSAVLGEEVL